MHWFVSDLPGPAVRAIADDWVAILNSYPQWAIEAACLWWLGPENANSHRKPSPGEIAKRASIEMTPVKSAVHLIEAYQKYGENPPAIYRK